MKGRTNSVSAASVPPGSSHRSKGDTNGGGDTTGEVFEARSSVSRVVNESTSVRGRYDTGRKKSRGLTVSFVTDENLSKDVTGRGKESGGGSGGGGGVRLCKRRSGEMSFAEEKEKGEHLMRSLNSSRFGALEHSSKSFHACACTLLCMICKINGLLIIRFINISLNRVHRLSLCM